MWQEISTHILTKRMTTDLWKDTSMEMDFNSHPHEEDDSAYFSFDNIQSTFQLTSSRRGWHQSKVKTNEIENFNSHPHEEDDSSRFRISTLSEYFNSHPHEEDDFILYKQTWNTIFQLTSSRRGWQAYRELIERDVLFQLTSSRRGWLQQYLTSGLMELFQLTSSRRGWPSTISLILEPYVFQLTSSRRGWQNIVQELWK